MEIGKKIKFLRQQNNLTQEELADRCELSKGFISQLENDMTSPSITTLTYILDALGTNLAEFFSEEQEEQVHWHVRQENRDAVMDTEVFCRKSDMLLVNYEAPDGTKKHNRLWNGGNGWGIIRLYDRVNGELRLADEVEATHIGCEYGEYEEP